MANCTLSYYFFFRYKKEGGFGFFSLIFSQFQPIGWYYLFYFYILVFSWATFIRCTVFQYPLIEVLLFFVLADLSRSWQMSGLKVQGYSCYLSLRSCSSFFKISLFLYLSAWQSLLMILASISLSTPLFYLFLSCLGLFPTDFLPFLSSFEFRKQSRIQIFQVCNQSIADLSLCLACLLRSILSMERQYWLSCMSTLQASTNSNMSSQFGYISASDLVSCAGK